MPTTSALVRPGPSLDPIADLRELTAYPFMVNALLAGAIVATLAGVVGWFMVLRRQSFAGHTLSLMAFPGATCALLLGLSAASGYFAFSVLAALAIAAATRRGAGRAAGQEAAATGTVQAVGLGLGFLFLSLYGGVLAGYESLLFGSFLGVTREQVLVLALVAGAALGALVAIGRPLLFASVDERVARAHGVPTGALRLGFMLLLGMAVAATAQITGVLLVFALLVAPPATARLLTARVGAGVALAVAIGVLVTWTGLALAYYDDYPVGFHIASLAFLAYLLVRIGRSVLGGRTRRRNSDPVGSAAAAPAPTEAARC